MQQESFIKKKKYVGSYNLTDFLTKSIQQLGHIETLVINMDCLKDTDEKIISALKSFKNYNPLDFVFYMDDIRET